MRRGKRRIGGPQFQLSDLRGRKAGRSQDIGERIGQVARKRGEAQAVRDCCGGRYEGIFGRKRLMGILPMIFTARACVPMGGTPKPQAFGLQGGTGQEGDEDVASRGRTSTFAAWCRAGRGRRDGFVLGCGGR